MKLIQTNIKQKHAASCYGYELVCVDDKFTKSFNSYLDKDAAYSVINSMLKKSKYCWGVIKKKFKKEFVIIRKKK